MSMRDTETPVKVEVIEERIRSNARLCREIQGGVAGTPINIDTIAQAIAAFERTFEPGLAPFDRWVEGDETAISEAAKRGFVLYNGKATVLRLPPRLALHRRPVPRHRHHHHRSRPRRGAQGRRVHAVCVQDADAARSVSAAAALHAPRSAATLYDAVRHYEKGGIDRPSRSPLMQPLAIDRAGAARSRRLHGIADGHGRSHGRGAPEPARRRRGDIRDQSGMKEPGCRPPPR